MRGKRALYGWRVDVAKLEKHFRAIESTIDSYTEGISLDDLASLADESSASGLTTSSYSEEGGFKSSFTGDRQGKRDLQAQSLTFDGIVYTIAHSVGFRAYVSVLGNIVWLSRNYVNPRGRVGPRGLSVLPSVTQVQAFIERADLEQPTWLLLEP